MPPSLGEQAIQLPSDTVSLVEIKAVTFFNLSIEWMDETSCKQVTIQLYVLFELKIRKNVF